jgi:hypothetical protein
MVRSVSVALCVLATALGGCGGDDDTAGASTDERATTTESTSTTVARRSTTTTTTSTTVPTTAAQPVSTTTAPPPPPPTTTTTASLPPFAASIKTVTADDLYASWRPGCPVPVEQLRAIDASHLGYDGKVHTGRLIVAANLAQGVVDVLRDLYAARFPIQRMQPVDVYGGDDNASMRANNTSGFNCRPVTGGSGWSEHAFGRAIDVNPLTNPYVKNGTVLPPEAARYADRSRNDPGMIHSDDATVRAFAARGWKWGGYWSSLKDYQHFSTTGR